MKHVDDSLPLTPHSSIVIGDWKLIFDWHGRLELYDVVEDISEQNNLASAQPERAAAMFMQLKSWLKENVQSHYFPKLNVDYNAEIDTRLSAFKNLWND